MSKSDNGLGFKYYFCTDCAVIHYREGGGRCADCLRKYHREYKRARRRIDPERKIKENARSLADMAVKRGKIKKHPCQWCGAKKAQMHHDDYTKPLAIEWLCAPCHQKFHKKQKVGELKTHLIRALSACGVKHCSIQQAN